GPRVLASMSEETSRKTLASLEHIGVKVLTNIAVKDYDGKNLLLSNGDVIETQSLLWSAGVKGMALSGLPEGSLLPNGRVNVNDVNLVNGTSNVYAIGDIAQLVNDERFPKGYPMVAQVAMQQGKQLG